MDELIIDKPFIKLFKSPRAYYLYSVNKHSVINISEDVYNFLDKENEKGFSDDVAEEISILTSEGWLSSKKVHTIWNPDTDRVENLLKKRVERITLQVTQACNLVCSYCPYANKTEVAKQRNHSNKTMDFSTAKKAIDFYFEHSEDFEKAEISFYGGEPLIAFDLIKKVVEYVNTLFLGKEITFTLTTNGTLFTDEIMDFLVDNDFTIMFSIDGPKRIHDINRKHIDGTGSFDQAYSNMLKLHKRYEKYGIQQTILINMVFDPKNDPDDIFELLKEPSISSDFYVRGNVYTDLYLDDKVEMGIVFTEKINYYVFLGLLDLYHIVEDVKIPYVIRNITVGVDGNNKRLTIGKNELPDVGSPGGPCIPGHFKLFVSVDGFFYPCEKVSELSDAMIIGTLNNGFEFDKVDAMLNVAKLTSEKCKNCWAFNFCGICPQYCDENGTFSAERRLDNCENQLKEAKKQIINFIQSLECKTVYKRWED